MPGRKMLTAHITRAASVGRTGSYVPNVACEILQLNVEAWAL
jgi:hypothetical protein